MGTPSVILQCHPTWLELTQNWIFNQLKYLPENQFETHIVCETTANLDQFAMPRMHVLGGRGAWRFWHEKLPRKLGLRNYSAFLAAVGSKECASLVHSHFGHYAYRNQSAVDRIPARHVITFYGYDVTLMPRAQPIWRSRYADLFKKADRILCEGPFMRQSIVALSCPPEKALVHTLGVETDYIPFRPRAWDASTPLRVLLAGRFVEKKGFPEAIAALAHLKNDVDLAITIVGDAKPDTPDELEKAKILAALAKGGLTDKTRLLGFQSHERLLIEAYESHIFLSPSFTASNGDSEGGAPITLIEMAASGMPVITTRHCDIPSVILDKKTGLLADEHDIPKLVAHLRWLMQNPQSWLEILSAGRTHIEQNYDARAQGKKLAEIYESLI